MNKKQYRQAAIELLNKNISQERCSPERQIISQGTYDRTDLHKASKSGNELVCINLLNQGFDIDTRNRKEWTPLMYAVLYGHHEIVEFLINNGADINAINAQRWNSMHLAARFGHTDIIKLLLMAGSLKNELTNQNYTALDLAIEYKKN